MQEKVLHRASCLIEKRLADMQENPDQYNWGDIRNTCNVAAELGKVRGLLDIAKALNDSEIGRLGGAIERGFRALSGGIQEAAETLASKDDDDSLGGPG